MTTEQELQKIARAWHQQSLQELIKPATIQDSSDLAYGLARVYRPDLRRTQVVNSLISTAGTDVWLLLMPDGEYSVLSINVPETVRKFSGAAGTVSTPAQVGKASGTVWAANNLEMGLCRPWAEGGYGLFVYVEPFVYDDQVVYGAIAITLPVSSGQRYIGTVYYDTVAGTLGVAYGTPDSRPAAAWSLLDAVAVAPGASTYLRLDSVLLANGITDVTYATCTFFQTREFLTLRSASSGAGDSLQIALTAQVFG